METKASNDNSQQPRETLCPPSSVQAQEAEELPYTVSVSVSLWLVNMAGEEGAGEGNWELGTENREKCAVTWQM